MKSETDNLAKERVQAEIAHLRAQTATEGAQAAKLNAERLASHPRLAHWLIDAIKILMAGVIGIGGVAAAITGYSLKEVQKAQMELQISKLKDEIARAQVERDNGLEKKKAMDAAVALTQQESVSAEQQLATLKRELIAVKAQLGDANGKAVDGAIAQTIQLQESVNNTGAQLGNTVARIEAVRTGDAQAKEIYAQIAQEASEQRLQRQRMLSEMSDAIFTSKPMGPFLNPRPNDAFEKYLQDPHPSASPN